MSVSLMVGLSGGLDSTVLLHLLHRMQQRVPQQFSLSAIHVHHGLQPAADDFALQCEALCRSLAVPLLIARVSIDAEEISSLGVEASARRHRYQAIAERMPENGALVLAHHRDDLLETVLLQWIRGAGLEGLTAMTTLMRSEMAGREITIWRPMLESGRDVLLRYATANGLTWTEDPSNADPDLARNRIRRDVMPVLRSLRSGADVAMARSVAHLQSARRLLEATGQRLETRGVQVQRLRVRDLNPQALLLADFGHPSIIQATARVAAADIVVVATPVYKAAYSGVLKVFLDLLPQNALKGKTVLPLATGGSPHHMLALDYALRPVLQSLGAKNILPGIYATDAQVVLNPEDGYHIVDDIDDRGKVSLSLIGPDGEPMKGSGSAPSEGGDRGPRPERGPRQDRGGDRGGRGGDRGGRGNDRGGRGNDRGGRGENNNRREPNRGSRPSEPAADNAVSVSFEDEFDSEFNGN